MVREKSNCYCREMEQHIEDPRSVQSVGGRIWRKYTIQELSIMVEYIDKGEDDISYLVCKLYMHSLNKRTVCRTDKTA